MPCGKTIIQRVCPAIQVLEEAASAFKKSIQLAPDGRYVHTVLAGIYGMMGREKDARAEASEVLRVNPKFSLDYYAKIVPYKDQSVTDRLVAARRKAGLK